MSVMSCLTLMKTSGMMLGKNPSSDLNVKYENITSIKAIQATKIRWIVLSPICNMYAMTLTMSTPSRDW